METALFRSLVTAMPDVDESSSQRVEELWAACRKFFAWEKETMRLREPTEQEQRDHHDLLVWMIRSVKLLLRVEESQPLRMLQIRLNESWEVFYNPMDEQTADAILGRLALRLPSNA